MEITFKDYEVSDKTISMTIKNNEFNGIYTDDYNKIQKENKCSRRYTR